MQSHKASPCKRLPLVRKSSSVSLRLLRCIVVVLLAIVDEFGGVSVLPTGHGALTLLINDEGFDLLDVIEFAIGEPKMVPFVKATPDRGDCVGGCQVDELRHVEDVEELASVAHVEPHPVSVRLQAHRLESEQLKEV